MLNKADQKQLKALYSEELKKVWESPKMRDYCMKSTAYIFEYDGHLFGIDKPTIKTDFCYGFGYYGIATEEEKNRASAMARKAKTDPDYFIEKNLDGLNRKLNQLNDILETLNRQGYSFTNVCYQSRYSSNVSNIYDYSFQRTCDRANNDTSTIADADFIKELIKALEEVKKGFTKRLNTYLKRYGLTKINSWTYLAD